jgi:hypothetical protein
MTDKEKLEAVLPYSVDSLEEIVAQYLRFYIDDFSPSRLRGFIKMLDIFLDTKIKSYEMAVDNSFEKARYIKSYLEGKMWKDEETAKCNVNAQIKNAESIIDFWHLAKGKRRSENE